MSKHPRLLFIVCAVLLPFGASALSAADERWKAPELIGAAITDVSGDRITFKGKESALRVPKQKIEAVRDVAQNSIGVAGLRPGMVISNVSLSADGTTIRSMTVAPASEQTTGTTSKSRSNIQNNRTGTSGTSAPGSQPEEQALNTQGTGTSDKYHGKPEPKVSASQNGQTLRGTSTKAPAAEHAIQTKGTGASGRSSAKASPSPTP